MMNSLTGFQRDLLYILAGLDSPKGLTVCKELAQAYGTTITRARVYQNLNKLAEQGLVEITEVDNRTNAYSLTTAGWVAIKTRREWENQYFSPDHPENHHTTSRL